jgi:hypothetical protein
MQIVVQSSPFFVPEFQYGERLTTSCIVASQGDADAYLSPLKADGVHSGSRGLPMSALFKPAKLLARSSASVGGRIFLSAGLLHVGTPREI